jgi:hypothetical protein
LKKSFWGDERKFLEPLMRFACGDMRGPHRFTQKRPRSFVSALRSIAVAVSAKKQLLRDFRRRSIFDFCITIPSGADIAGATPVLAAQARGVPDANAR